MDIIIEAFPKLTGEMLGKSGYASADYVFSFNDNDITRRLVSSIKTYVHNSRTLILKDECGRWNSEDYGLTVEYNAAIDTPTVFFGPQGIAAEKESVVGVALIWEDPNSQLRGAIHIGEFSHKVQKPFALHGVLNFPSNTLSGELTLKSVLYLKKSGTPSGSEKHLANNPGTVLGSLDETVVIIDGNDSIIPVHNVSKPGEPLWWVVCKWDDPTCDLFSDDYFCIYINKAHKDFSSLYSNEGIKQSPLLLEIFSSSLQLLVSKVLSDSSYGQQTIKGEKLASGSISSVVNYFIRVYGWSYNAYNPEELAISIRKTLMNKR